ncbi:MAG TPA: hypothetical protein VFA28_16055 [Bryobacteraceae bacterium]|jgi:hypothetical protein|nr:hypothetical protein [Bryobacteraceae bacterium]
MAFPLDISLNVVWAAICVAAIAWALSLERQGRRCSIWIRTRRLASVLLIALALFPSVSVSDDEISFWFLFAPSSHRSGSAPIEESKERSAQQLARVLNALEHFQVNGIWTFTLTLFFLSLVLIPVPVATERLLVCRAGRAPPSAPRFSN